VRVSKIQILVLIGVISIYFSCSAVAQEKQTFENMQTIMGLKTVTQNQGSEYSEYSKYSWISMETSAGSQKCLIYEEGSFLIKEWNVTIHTSIPIQIRYGKIKQEPSLPEGIAKEVAEVWITRYPNAYSLFPDIISLNVADIEDAWIPLSSLQGQHESLPVSEVSFFPQSVALKYYTMRKIRYCGAKEEVGETFTINLVPSL